MRRLRLPQVGRFTGAVGLFLVLNAAVKLTWLLMDNLLQDQFGHAAYGQYASILQLTLLLTAVYDVASAVLLVQRLPQESAEGRRALMSTYVHLRALMTGAYLIVTLGALALLGHWRVAPHLSLALLLAAVAMNWLAFGRTIWQVEGQWARDAWTSVADKLLLLPLVGVLVWGSGDLERLGWGTLASGALALLLCWPWGRVAWLPFDRKLAEQVVRQSAPLMLMAALLALSEKLGIVAVERLVSPRAAGLYAGAHRWTSAGLMAIYLLQPWLLARYTAAGADEARRLLIRGTGLFAALTGWVAAAFVAYPDAVLVLLGRSTPDELATMRAHLSWQGPALWATGLLVSTGTYLTSRGRIGALNGMLAVVVSLYALGLVLVLPRAAATWASALLLGAWAAQGLGYVVLFTRSEGWGRWPWRAVGGIALGSAASAGAALSAATAGLTPAIGMVLAGLPALATAGLAFALSEPRRGEPKGAA